MRASFDLAVANGLWGAADAWEAPLARAFDACARHAGAAWPDREISVLLSDDTAIRALNLDWRGKDKATNVLSFPTVAPVGAPAEMLRDLPLGDIAIAYETAAREARDEDKVFEHHVVHLAVHGALHLIGFDHETEKDAHEMEAAERRILAGLGIADPYRDSEPVELSADIAR